MLSTPRKRTTQDFEPLIIPMDSLNKTSTPQITPEGTQTPFEQIREQTSRLGNLEVPFLSKTSSARYLPGQLAQETAKLIIPQSEVESMMMVAPLGMVAKGLSKTPIGKKVAEVVQKEVPSVFKGFKDLTTKFLEYAKGKTILSKQEIMDFAKSPN